MRSQCNRIQLAEHVEPDVSIRRAVVNFYRAPCIRRVQKPQRISSRRPAVRVEEWGVLGEVIAYVGFYGGANAGFVGGVIDNFLDIAVCVKGFI